MVLVLSVLTKNEDFFVRAVAWCCQDRFQCRNQSLYKTLRFVVQKFDAQVSTFGVGTVWLHKFLLKPGATAPCVFFMFHKTCTVVLLQLAGQKCWYQCLSSQDMENCYSLMLVKAVCVLYSPCFRRCVDVCSLQDAGESFQCWYQCLSSQDMEICCSMVLRMDSPHPSNTICVDPTAKECCNDF